MDTNKTKRSRIKILSEKESHKNICVRIPNRNQEQGVNVTIAFLYGSRLNLG